MRKLQKRRCLGTFSTLSDDFENLKYTYLILLQLPEKGDALKPVMFYLFGGGYTEGQKDAFLYGPDFLVAKDVVLVIPNYRLHIFGKFLIRVI